MVCSVQPELHKADCTILDMHRKENSLRDITAAIHSTNM